MYPHKQTHIHTQHASCHSIKIVYKTNFTRRIHSSSQPTVWSFDLLIIRARQLADKSETYMTHHHILIFHGMCRRADQLCVLKQKERLNHQLCWTNICDHKRNHKRTITIAQRLRAIWLLVHTDWECETHYQIPTTPWNSQNNKCLPLEAFMCLDDVLPARTLTSREMIDPNWFLAKQA